MIFRTTEAAAPSVPAWRITTAFLPTPAKRRAECFSRRRLAVNLPFAVGRGGASWRGECGGVSLRKPPGVVPYDEARPSEHPPPRVPQVSQAAFNHRKWAALTTGCISRAPRSLERPLAFLLRRGDVGFLA